MLFKVSLYAALGIFLFGLALRISGWFRLQAGASARDPRPGRRLAAALRAFVSPRLVTRLPRLSLTCLADVLLLRRLWRESRLRWLAHQFILCGFTLLLIFHALERLVSSRLFPDYASTLNPFLALRSVSFLLVMTGLALGVWRRIARPEPRHAANRSDTALLVVLAVIMISGVLLEAAKIGSQAEYRRMVAEFSDLDEGEESRALESYWVSEFGVVSPTVQGPFDAGTLAAGAAAHQEYCAECHSRPRWSAAGYGIARLVRPVAGTLDAAGLPRALWIIHWLASLIGLAALPFGKGLHALSGPLSLLINGAAEGSPADPANLATRQVLELDACVHCGICTSRCSVAAVVAEVGNRNILPAEKMVALKALFGAAKPAPGKLARIQEGLHLCTDCRHCTDACPMGINLQELWFTVRETMLGGGVPELLALSPLSFNRGLKREAIGAASYAEPARRAWRTLEAVCASLEGMPLVDAPRLSPALRLDLASSGQGNTFSTCLECRICTASCPVVGQCADRPESLGLVPHQLMHAAKLGLAEPIFRSPMLWKCLGCYQCQESCPQGVQVADVLFELRYRAAAHVAAATARAAGEAGA